MPPDANLQTTRTEPLDGPEQFLRVALGRQDLSPSAFLAAAAACAAAGNDLYAYLTIKIGFERYVFGTGERPGVPPLDPAKGSPLETIHAAV